MDVSVPRGLTQSSLSDVPNILRSFTPALFTRTGRLVSFTLSVILKYSACVRTPEPYTRTSALSSFDGSHTNRRRPDTSRNGSAFSSRKTFLIYPLVSKTEPDAMYLSVFEIGPLALPRTLTPGPE